MLRCDAPKRVLMLDYQLVADDLARALARLGTHVARLSPRGLTSAALSQAVADLRPSFLLSINYAPELALLAGQLSTPYVSWTIDPLPRVRLRVLHGTNTDNCLCFVHRRKLVERFERLGFKDVRPLPLAAATRRAQSAMVPGPPAHTISFVGNSLRGERATFDAALAGSGWPTSVRQQIETWILQWVEAADGDPSRGAIEASDLPKWLPTREPEVAEEWAELLAGAAGAEYRRRAVRGLALLHGAVYGDAGWRGIADYRGMAHHGDALTRIYQTSLLNLDVPRLYQREVATLRAFDVMAAGGLLLSEAGGDLDRLVPSDCFARYASTRELPHVAEELARNPARARQTARAARDHVAEHHLIEHRLSVILDACRQRDWID